MPLYVSLTPGSFTQPPFHRFSSLQHTTFIAIPYILTAISQVHALHTNKRPEKKKPPTNKHEIEENDVRIWLKGESEQEIETNGKNSIGAPHGNGNEQNKNCLIVRCCQENVYNLLLFVSVVPIS